MVASKIDASGCHVPLLTDRFAGFGRPVRVFVEAVGLCGRSSGAEPRQASEVVDETGHADGAHEERHAVLPGDKNMVDARADPGA
jgi:hypothetical protein